MASEYHNLLAARYKFKSPLEFHKHLDDSDPFSKIFNELMICRRFRLLEAYPLISLREYLIKESPNLTELKKFLTDLRQKSGGEFKLNPSQDDLDYSGMPDYENIKSKNPHWSYFQKKVEESITAFKKDRNKSFD
jgi:hypothetical protein